ncbi:MAG: SDR family oxidoreductase [Alphaproteobacteria bacterium]
MARYKAVIAGATGIVGGPLVRHLTSTGDWDVVGLARRKPAQANGVTYLPVDLTDPADCNSKLSGIDGVTHVFYTARFDHDTRQPEPIETNTAMLRHLVEAIEPNAPDLQHVHLVHGTKYYGSHKGPFQTPAREDGPRTLMDNFYYWQQDWIADRQRNKRWGWSVTRPHGICDFADGIARSMVRMIAIYAAISKELGLPLRFPGSAGNYTAMYQCTESMLLARAMTFMSTNRQCDNEAFNVINGDYIRWCNLWPGFAKYFGMELGPVQTVDLVSVMADKGPVWDRIVEKHGLRKAKLEELVVWAYGNFIWNTNYDIMSSVTKLRQKGFHEVVDTEAMFYRIFDELRAAKVIP